MFDKRFLGAWDLADKQSGKPRDVTVTIAKVVSEALQSPGTTIKRRKPVISFERTEKSLACNATNAHQIAALHGKDPRAWVGKRITLYPTTTKFGRETVDCIRVRDRIPGANQKSEGVESRPVDPAMEERQRAAADQASEPDNGYRPRFDPSTGELPEDPPLTGEDGGADAQSAHNEEARNGRK